MAEVTWFKVLTDIFADDKIKIIQSMPEGDALLVMWFKVLSQAGKTNDGGYIYLRKNIPYTSAMLATLFNKSQMMVELALKTFSQFEMIDIDENGYIFVSNWEKHQSIDKLNLIKEKTRMRVQNHRDKKKQELLESNATVTLPLQRSNAIDLELDLDLERTSTTGDFESLEKTHLRIFGGNIMASSWMSYYQTIRKKGYADPFIRELLLEASETAKTGVSQRFIDAIFERWNAEGIKSREEARSRKEESVSGNSTIGRTGQAARYKDPALESRREEIALNKWIDGGNDPSGFIYVSASGD